MDRWRKAPALIRVGTQEIPLPEGISHHISHNEHVDCGLSMEDYLTDFDDRDISPIDRAECLRTDEVWKIQIYVDTPVGFIVGLGPTFQAALFKLHG